MSRRLALGLLFLLTMTLLVGTQIPGGWRDGIEHRLHAPSSTSAWAHFILFALIAFLVSVRPLAWSFQRVMAGALGLALLTEGLQFFALNRHPRLADIAIDLTGTLLALMLARSHNRRVRLE